MLVSLTDIRQPTVKATANGIRLLLYVDDRHSASTQARKHARTHARTHAHAHVQNKSQAYPFFTWCVCARTDGASMWTCTMRW
jgi:hypothetical protein